MHLHSDWKELLSKFTFHVDAPECQLTDAAKEGKKLSGRLPIFLQENAMFFHIEFSSQRDSF